MQDATRAKIYYLHVIAIWIQTMISESPHYIHMETQDGKGLIDAHFAKGVHILSGLWKHHKTIESEL